MATDNSQAFKIFHAPEIDFPEMFVGLVSPIGVDRGPVIRSLKSAFYQYDYNVYHVKISETMANIAEYIQYNDLDGSSTRLRIESYIKLGNFLRKRIDNSVLAAVAMSNVVLYRNKTSQFHKNMFIIDQLKTEDEIILLRRIYGESFLQVSVYSPRDVRVDYLARQFAHDAKSADTNHYRSFAEDIVVKDEDEKDRGNDLSWAPAITLLFSAPP